MAEENKWKPQNADGDEQEEELDETVSFAESPMNIVLISFHPGLQSCQRCSTVRR